MPDSQLNLYTRKEAIIKGAYLEKPEKHDILAAIEEKTTLKNAKSLLLMSYEALIQLLNERFTEINIQKSLIELKLDHMIAIIPGISYNESSHLLIPEMFFISRPEKKAYDIPDVYREILDKSVASVVAYSKNNNLFDRDLFWKDLESSLSQDGNFEINYSQIYFSLDSIFENSEYFFKAEKKVYEQFKYDLMKQLVHLRRAVWLLDQKIFLIPGGNIGEIASTLTAFFYNRIIPEYELVSVVARECDVIRQEEEIYNTEVGHRKTMRFTAQKAYSVQKYLEEERYADDRNYPGKLVFTIIRELEKFINEFHEKDYVALVYSKFEELKSRIQGKGEISPSPICFFDEAELSQYPPEAIEKVKHDRSIIHTSWERKGSTFEVFMEMTYEKFYGCLELFKNMPNSENWKILAYRKLLQDSRKITPEINPFNNPNFLKKYGLILNEAYINILPFYYNMLLLIQVNFVRNLVYRSIKNYIEDMQKQVARANENQREIRKKVIKNQIGEKKAYLKRLITRNRILEELDFFYFRQNSIPCILDVRERFPDIRDADFIHLIKEFQFTIIPTESSDQWGQNILYYPKSTAWNYNLEKTRNQLERLLKMGDGLYSKNSKDHILTKRIHALNMNLQLLN